VLAGAKLRFEYWFVLGRRPGCWLSTDLARSISSERGGGFEDLKFVFDGCSEAENETMKKGIKWKSGYTIANGFQG